MDEFLVALSPRRANLFLEEVFDRFHIVVGRFFDVLDPLGVLEGEVGVEAAQVGKRALRYAFQLGQLCAQPAQGDEVFHFHLNAVAYQARIRKSTGPAFRRWCGSVRPEDRAR